jgi:hypothetical protein
MLNTGPVIVQVIETLFLAIWLRGFSAAPNKTP